MATRMIHYSNCDLNNIQIQCSRQWEIPNFGTWITANQGKWLDGPEFSPSRGIQLQMKILGSATDSVRIFLRNCRQSPATFSKISLTFDGWGYYCDANGRPGSAPGFVSLSTSVKASFVLGLSEEFQFNWTSKSSYNWKLKTTPSPERLRGNSCKFTLILFFNIRKVDFKRMAKH